jgi:copper ion binding protein
MKIFILFSFVFFIALSGCKTSTSSEPISSNQLADTAILLAKTEFQVKGMHCTGCENTIKSSVTELQGIAQVEASFKDNKALVSYDSTKTNDIAILKAIEDAGYKVDTFMRK